MCVHNDCKLSVLVDVSFLYHRSVFSDHGHSDKVYRRAKPKRSNNVLKSTQLLLSDFAESVIDLSLK